MITINGKTVSFGTYPNGEVIFKNIGREIAASECGLCRVEFAYDNGGSSARLDELVIVLAVLSQLALPELELELHVPYFPYGRMDRELTDEHGDVYDNTAFALASLIRSQLSEWREWRVVTFDTHNPAPLLDALGAHYANVEPSASQILASVGGVDVVCFPDKGAFERYGLLFDGLTRIHADKERDRTTGRIRSIKIAPEHRAVVEGSSVLICDDICSYGGTVRGVAAALRALGAARVTAVFSHVESRPFADGGIAQDANISAVWAWSNSGVSVKPDRVSVRNMLHFSGICGIIKS